MLAPLQLGLGVQMHYHFASRFLIDSLHHHNVCCPYEEVGYTSLREILPAPRKLPYLTWPNEFVQYAHNVDHNIWTHLTVTPTSTDTVPWRMDDLQWPIRSWSTRRPMAALQILMSCGRRRSRLDLETRSSQTRGVHVILVMGYL